MAYNYMNPYGMYANSYTNSMPYTYQPVQQQVSQPEPIKWVEGEIGAKAYQMPTGWPANTPIPLWDTTDTVIYMKSVNQMGMPNPMQKLKYTIEEQHVELPAGKSGDSAPQYATIDELKDMMRELSSELKKDMKDMMSENKTGGGNRNVKSSV